MMTRLTAWWRIWRHVIWRPEAVRPEGAPISAGRSKDLGRLLGPHRLARRPGGWRDEIQDRDDLTGSPLFSTVRSAAGVGC